MTTLKDLQTQQEALAKQQQDIAMQIEALRLQDRSKAIAQAIELIAEYQLTQKDLFSKTSAIKKVKSASKVAAKYRNPVDGKTWSGRGLVPKWMKNAEGNKREEFLIG